MTEQELQVAMVRMRLFDAAHAEVLEHLENLTKLSRGTLAHAMMAVPAGDTHPGIQVFHLWLEWGEQLAKHDGYLYENFAVYVRHKVQEAQQR